MAAWKMRNITITVDELAASAAELKEQGCRLVQIGCVKEPVGDCPAETLELIYSFDKAYELTNLRLVVSPTATVPSISGAYGCAFLYENEIHELFGLAISDIGVDFKGSLYKVAKPQAFNPVAG